MKKHTKNISTIAVLCVFCATAAGNSFAAGSVRALGGTGTYNGTTSAVASNAARVATANRAGSLRISPSMTRTVSAGTRVNSDGSTTSTERLSIGKYLGGATSVSASGGTSSSTPSSTGIDPADLTDIKGKIATVESKQDALDTTIAGLDADINAKQDKLTAGDYIIIDSNDEVSVDLDELAKTLDVKKVRYNAETDYLQWSDDGVNWDNNLFKVSDLTGDYVSESELGSAIANLASKATVDALETRVGTAEEKVQALQNIVDALNIPDQVQANWDETNPDAPAFIKNKPADLVKTSDLAGYAKSADLEDYATVVELDDLADAVASNTAALGEGFDSENTVAEAIATKQNAISDLTQIRDNAAAGAAASAALENYATKASLADYAKTADIPAAQVNSDWNATSGVAEIKNKPDMSNYLTKPEIPAGSGQYLLMVNNDGETVSYSWENAAAYDSGSTEGDDFDWDDSGW